jgi:hypothetical protein
MTTRMTIMTSKNLKALLVPIVLICQLSLIKIASAAQNIEDLVNQGKLSISLKVNQKEQQIVGQALVLAIDISTDRWFATGSKIQDFTLTDVVMQANNTTTINGNKRIKGQTWATQTHEITLYPTAYGDYQVPPINVDISVNTENDGIISGVLTTPATIFNIQLPEELKDIDNFIVSSQVTLSINGQLEEEADYAVGEALTQTITITASDIPAMMITPVDLVLHNLALSNKTVLDGVSIYHKPAQVFDKSNRGTLLGTRVESFTYIFEKPGSYKIDEQAIYWWNSQTSTLERLLIPSSTWTVSDGGLSQFSLSTRLTSFNITIEKIVALITVILLLTLISVGFIKRHNLSVLYNKVTKREQRLLRNHFLACITQKNHLAATQYLYQYALLSNKQADNKDCPLSEKLNTLAFNDIKVENPPISFSIDEAKALIKKIDISAGIKVNPAHFPPKERIKLNNLNFG